MLLPGAILRARLRAGRRLLARSPHTMPASQRRPRPAPLLRAALDALLERAFQFSVAEKLVMPQMPAAESLSRAADSGATNARL